MKKLSMFFLFPIFALLFSGCPSEQSYLAKHSPAFRQGYRDGCENAEAMVANSFVGKSNDTSRYRKDPEYRRGWDDGYSRCYANAEMEQYMRRPGAFYYRTN